MSLLPTPQYAYTQEESLELLIHSIKANRDCKTERKAFNLCRTTLLGKLVDPNYCLDKATAQVDCFQKVRRDEKPSSKDAYKKVFECAKGASGSWTASCQSQLEEYLSS